MAITNTLPTNGHGGKQPSAPLIALAVDAALTGTYATGGYDFNPGAILQSLGKYDKAPVVLAVLVEGIANGFHYQWNRATNKLMVFQGDNDNAGDGPAVELPNLTAHVFTPRVLIIAQ